MLILPEGYRPAKNELHISASVTNEGNYSFGCCDILTTGEVVPNFGNIHILSLDGITFRAK
jgi:hypothetical protein